VEIEEPGDCKTTSSLIYCLAEKLSHLSHSIFDPNIPTKHHSTPVLGITLSSSLLLFLPDTPVQSKGPYCPS
jgi:hypothetical protein